MLLYSETFVIYVFASDNCQFALQLCYNVLNIYFADSLACIRLPFCMSVLSRLVNCAV